MPNLDINGIEVNFPFDPYPCQVNYMKGVLDSIIKVNKPFIFLNLKFYNFIFKN